MQEMPELAQAIHEMIGGAGRLRRGEIAAMAGIVRPTALRHLNALVDAGLVRRVAKSCNDLHAQLSDPADLTGLARLALRLLSLL